MKTGTVHVAVIGMGDIGRGWASLCVAAGWPVSIYDNEAQASHDAPEEVSDRARALVALERATDRDVERGIRSITVGKSLLQACGEAQWVIESVPEDLRLKQQVFQGLSATAKKARVVTSSTSGYAIQDIVAQSNQKERCLVAHPLNPPELIPLIELAPGPDTDPAAMELLKGWLRALRKIPVVINKHVPGNVANRIAAAVWREAIDLVLKGVIDVQDLDRAVSLGPALGWAAGGPHLTYHLASGSQGVSGFLQHLLGMYEETWSDLATWSHLNQKDQQKLTHAVERAYEEDIEKIRRARDGRLVEILRGLERARLLPRLMP